jgi:hypothetical protein
MEYTLPVSEENKWVRFINKTNNKRVLDRRHYMSKLLWVSTKPKDRRALSLGPGAGNEEIDLICNGWVVTGVDIEPYSNEVIIKRIKNKNKFKFQNTSFECMVLAGKYSYVLAYNSLPFSKKKYLHGIINNISSHMNKGAVFVFNLFGSKHTKVIHKKCYSVTEPYIKKLLSNFNIKYINRVQFDRPIGDHWDEFNIIAIKK